LEFKIDFTLPEADFRKQIDEVIHASTKAEVLLPLPCHVDEESMEFAALILTQLDCTSCDARCCRTTKLAKFGIPFWETEYELLAKRIGAQKLAAIPVRSIGKNKYMPTPCPFLRKNSCSVHDIRPWVCIYYPIDPSGADVDGHKLLTVDPQCPEARRIAKRTYLMLWRLFNKMKEASPQAEHLLDGVRQEQMLRFFDAQGGTGKSV
jgi:Fe-S-cluster containining protein